MNKVKKVKVCHISSVHSVTDIRILEKECTSLTKRYEVYLVVPSVGIKEKNGVHIVNVPLTKGGRLKRMLITTFLVYKRALEIDAEVYHVHDPELLPYAVKLKGKGKKVIYDAHEDIEGQIVNKEYIPFFLRKFIYKIIRTYLYYCLRKFDGIITVSPHIVDKFLKIRNDITLITNFPISNKSNIFNDYTQKNICFPGLISKDWMHENIIRALSQTEGVRYLLAGPTSLDFISQLKKMENWQYVDYLGQIPSSKVKEMFEKSSIGIALFDYTPNAAYKRGTLGNTKLFEYMQNGLPIICTDFTLWKEIVEQEKCGICINPHDINSISEAINYLISNPDIAKEMGENGRNAVKSKYNWEEQEVKLFNLYHKILKNE